MPELKELESAVRRSEERYLEKKSAHERLAEELKYDLAKLDGMRAALEIVRNATVELVGFDSDTSDQDSNMRRNRLGLKKRVIYELVALGVFTFGDLEEAVRNTDIDAKYIGEVLRAAVSAEDMTGSFEEGYFITASGREILAKAPLPKDWNRYLPILEARGGGRRRSNENGEAEASPDVGQGSTPEPNSNQVPSRSAFD